MHPAFFQKFLIVTAAFAAFFGFTGFIERAKAQQDTPFKIAAEGLTLSPPSFEMTLKPGEETAYTIRVTNPTKNLIELYPSAGNFTASGDDGQPKYEIGTTAIENTSSFSIASWISFYTPKVALLPEQVVEFKFRIKVPEDAEPGGHYGIVFLGTKPPEDKDQKSQVALSSMVGSLLLVRIPGDVREETSIEEFSAPWFFFTPPVDFNIFLRNTGNIHVRPQGEVSITDWRGQDIDRLDINPKKGSILPESRRKFDVSWTPNISPFWKIPLGKFHATLKITYGQSSKTISQPIAFWVIPKWLIITISIFLFLVFTITTLLFIRKRKRNRRTTKRIIPPHNPRTPTFPLQTNADSPSGISPLHKAISQQNAFPSPQRNVPSRPPQHPPVQGAHPQTPSTVQSASPREWLGRIAESNASEKSNKKQLRF